MAVKSSFTNMVACLGCVTLVCALLLGVVYVYTEEAVSAAQQAKSTRAIEAVSPAFDSLCEEKEADGKTSYYVARDAEGANIALIVTAETSKGFGGKIKMMVGFLPDGSIYDTSVLEHSETPGLGAKATEEGFKGQFRGFNPALKKLIVKKDGGDVDAITAATITSRAYCDALQTATDKFNTLSQTVFPQPQPEEEPAAEEENIEEDTRNE